MPESCKETQELLGGITGLLGTAAGGYLGNPNLFTPKPCSKKARSIIMAKKFFSSNYGSPLMRVDNSGIQQAGQAYGQAAKARGQMFANIGSQIGGRGY